jgi:hypothetical protein
MEPYVSNIASAAESGSAIILDIIVPAALALLLLIIIIRSVRGIKDVAISVGGDCLEVSGPFHRAKVPLGEININGVKRLNLFKHKDYDIDKSVKINKKGYWGWKALRNGRRAFLYVTDKSRVTIIPTPDYDVLLSVKNPGGLKNALKKNQSAFSGLKGAPGKGRKASMHKIMRPSTLMSKIMDLAMFALMLLGTALYVLLVTDNIDRLRTALNM